VLKLRAILSHWKTAKVLQMTSSKTNHEFITLRKNKSMLKGWGILDNESRAIFESEHSRSNNSQSRIRIKEIL